MGSWIHQIRDISDTKVQVDQRSVRGQLRGAANGMRVIG